MASVRDQSCFYIQSMVVSLSRAGLCANGSVLDRPAWGGVRRDGEGATSCPTGVAGGLLDV